MSTGEYDAARTDIAAALGKNAFSAEAVTCRGVWEQAQFRLDDAVADYDRAIALDPTLPDPYLRRAVIYAFQGRASDAFDDMYRGLTGDIHRAGPTLGLPTDLPAAVKPPADLLAAAVKSNIGAIPAAPQSASTALEENHRPTLLAAQMEVLRGGWDGADRDLGPLISDYGSAQLAEAARTRRLIQLLKTSGTARLSRDSLAAQIVDVLALVEPGYYVSLPWLDRAAKLVADLAGRQRLRAWDAGSAPWTAPAGKVQYYAALAGGLDAKGQTDAALAQLNKVRNDALQLCPDPHGDDWAAVYAF